MCTATRSPDEGRHRDLRRCAPIFGVRDIAPLHPACLTSPPQSSAKQPCELPLVIQVDQSVEFIRSALAAKGGYFYRSTPEDVAYAMV